VVSLRDRRSSVELNERLGTGVAEVVRRGRLRWFGHLERKNEEDWVSRCRELGRLLVPRVEVGAGRRGLNVLKRTYVH
jgi:hypothetical protein